MLAEVRPPVTALASLVTLLSQSACLVTVFVKDAGGADEATGSGGMSGGAEDMAEGTAASSGAGSGEATSTAGLLGSTGAPGFDVGAPDPLGLYCDPMPIACDGEDSAVDHALGLNCPGGIKTEGPLTWIGSDLSRITTGVTLGITKLYEPTEGGQRVMLSTGVAEHALLTLAQLPVEGNCPNSQTCPSTELPGEDLNSLPPPIDPTPQKCKPNMDLPGAGDCSGTVLEQWELGGEPLVAYDYTELRFVAQVPQRTMALRLDFAFFTSEYPPRFPGGHNDMFVAWVSSEKYTGNFALDPEANPIAAETLPYTIKLDAMPFDCEPNCPDEPLRGFAFEGHAGTPWLPAEVPVTAGETVEVVFALFDVGDGKADSAVLLDGVQWVCSPPPTSE